MNFWPEKKIPNFENNFGTSRINLKEPSKKVWKCWHFLQLTFLSVDILARCVCHFFNHSSPSASHFHCHFILLLSHATLGRTHNTREKYWTSRSRVGVQKVPEPKIGTHNNLRGQVPIGTRPWTSRSGTWPSRSGTFPSTYIDFSLKMHLFQLNSSIKLHELY